MAFLSRFSTFQLCMACCFLLSLLGSKTEAATSFLTLLDKGEVHDGIIANGDYLYVGQSRLNFDYHPKISIYNHNDRLVTEIPLKHSATHIAAYGRGIIVVGTSPTPHLTNYTRIDPVANGQFKATLTQIPMDAWANDWVGTYNGREYFTDMGGNPNDPAADADPYLPSQTIFSTNSSGRPAYMSTRLQGPALGTIFGSQLLIASFKSIGSDIYKLTKVQIGTGTQTPAFNQIFGRLKNIAIKPGSSVVALSDQTNGVVVIGDLSSSQILTSLPTGGATSYAEWYGHCVVASNLDNRQVVVFDTSDLSQAHQIAAIDFAHLGEGFGYLNRFTIDSTSGRIFAKSNYPCNPIMENCSINTNAVASSDANDGANLKRLCQ
jgi:hypothetical protein